MRLKRLVLTWGRRLEFWVHFWWPCEKGWWNPSYSPWKIVDFDDFWFSAISTPGSTRFAASSKKERIINSEEMKPKYIDDVNGWRRGRVLQNVLVWRLLQMRSAKFSQFSAHKSIRLRNTLALQQQGSQFSLSFKLRQVARNDDISKRWVSKGMVPWHDSMISQIEGW